MKKPRVVHPLLVAFYPILFLYAHNMGEMKANQILLLLGVSFGLALFIWLLLGLWLKDRAKAGLLTSIFVFLLFTYGHFYYLLGKQDIFIPKNAFLAGIVLVLGCCIYFIRRSRSDFTMVTRVLNIAATVVIAINVFTIVSYQIRVSQISSTQPGTIEQEVLLPSTQWSTTEQAAQILSTQPNTIEPAVQTPLTQPSATEPVVQQKVQSMPDIYFIVLDEYASPDVVKKYLNYDNEQFIKSLENKGFFVARSSTTPYRDTVINIASILNMEWIPKNEFGNPPYESITNNKVVNSLQSLGYKYVYFGQWFELGRYEIKADAYFNYYKESSPVTSELWNTLWKTTILNTIFEESSQDNYYREGLIRTLEQLGKTPEMEGPKFVYAHVICPHDPFVFGPNGEPVNSGYAYYEYNDRYLGQYQFITREIDKVIEEILKKSTTDPIIIVQSDHGAKLLPEWNKILNAYHLPGDGRKLLDDAVSPVNTFRIIFNHYFNTSYELLDDRLP
jgi:hypothetical protein